MNELTTLKTTQYRISKMAKLTKTAKIAKYVMSEGAKAAILADPREAWLLDALVKSTSNELKLSNGGYFLFEKPDIKTEFCFGYHLSRTNSESFDRAGEQAEQARKDVDLFIERNLKKLKADLEELKTERIFWRRYSKTNTFVWRNARRAYDDFELENLITDEDRHALIKLYEVEIEKFTKRLNTYLKRYGLSKVNSHMYWIDE